MSPSIRTLSGQTLRVDLYGRRLTTLYLRRKSGYLSSYGLSMIYPSWKAGVFCQGKADASPIMLRIGKRVVGMPPWLIRFPSWLDRKIRGRDAGGFVRWPGRPDHVVVWKRPGYVPQRLRPKPTRPAKPSATPREP